MKFIKKFWEFVETFFKRPLSTKPSKTIETDEDATESIPEVSNETIDPPQKHPLITGAPEKLPEDTLLGKPKIPKTPIARTEVTFHQNELDHDLIVLNQKRKALEEKIVTIDNTPYPDTSYIDQKVTHLLNLVNKNTKDGTICLQPPTHPHFDDDLDKLEDLLQEHSTINRHQQRESYKQQQEALFRAQVNDKLRLLERHLEQDQIEEAPYLIKLLEGLLKPEYSQERQRLDRSKALLAKKEELIRKKQLAEEAERLRIEKERAKEKAKLLREQHLVTQLNTKLNTLETYIQGKRFDKAKNVVHAIEAMIQPQHSNELARFNEFKETLEVEEAKYQKILAEALQRKRELEALAIQKELEKAKEVERLAQEREVAELLNIQNSLGTLEAYLSKDDLGKAKLVLATLKGFKLRQHPTAYRKFLALKKSYESKEHAYLKQQEEVLQQYLAKKAARRRQKQEQIQEAQRIAKEVAKQKQLARQQQQKALQDSKAEQLDSLLSRKQNWRAYQAVLQANNIRCFYHFTDRSNLASIKQQKGLYSWYYCETNGIGINSPGGDSLSKSLDEQYGVEDYARVSFCNDHPMQYRLKKEGKSLVVLTVDLEVAYFENTLFCDMNATDNNHSKGPDLDDLKAINFPATKRTYLRREDPDFKPHQAEVLVKTWIPLKYITNINNHV